jgi:hypothetical protein
MARERGVESLGVVLRIEGDGSLPELRLDCLALLAAWAADPQARPVLAGPGVRALWRGFEVRRGRFEEEGNGGVHGKDLLNIERFNRA